ncbi:MAG: PAS domain S-box-containing protein [Candidatus Azotimanducaceae bacterium]|jgi:PAS domain S-box-containing protein
MTLRKKIILLFIVSSLLTGGYVFQLWLPNSEQMAVDALVEATDRELSSISEVLIGSILRNELGLVYENLNVLEGERDNWVSLELVAADGQRLYPIGNLIGKQKASQLVLKHPIYYRYEQLATLTLVIDFEKEVETVKAQIFELVNTLYAGFFIIFLIVMYFLDVLVRRPAWVLSDAARQLAAGDFSAPLPIQSNDELGSLAASFSVMRDYIQHSQEHIAFEIKEKEKRAAELILSNELMQFVDTASAPIFGINVQGRANEWNQRSEQITGFSRKEVMGRDLVADFITDDYKDSVGEVLAKALNGEETVNFEFSLSSKSGGRVDILFNSTTRRDASGQIVGVIGVGQDITELNRIRIEQGIERKEATAQIIHASKLATLGEMSTSVAHELNQPLNVIRMAAGNSRRKISNGTADSEYLNDKLERIEGQAARAAAIIDHMRMFGRETKEHPTRIDPRFAVTNALELMGEQLRSDGIEIVTELAGDCPSIFGHAIQMEQVILNLLSNARDAMAGREGKKITLRVFECRKGVNITSEDTGGGIPEEVLPRIFEPFYTTKEMGKGTGLGLSVGYGIVREMNGTIVADNINGGARFTITLPSVS